MTKKKNFTPISHLNNDKTRSLLTRSLANKNYIDKHTAHHDHDLRKAIVEILSLKPATLADLNPPGE